MEYVTLVNRTSKNLNGTWNGRQFVVKPGEQLFPRAVANAIKRQNPLMGSQGTEIWDTVFLCGIKEDGDDTEKLEQSNSVELMNPKILHGGRETKIVAGETGMYKTRASVATELPPQDMVGFEKP